MKLIIDIPEYVYNDMIKLVKVDGDIDRLVDVAIVNGTPLEKHDAVSRQAVLDLAKFDGRDGLGTIIHAFDVEQLPPVNPKEPKTGHWILDETDNSITCNKCGCLMWASDLCHGDAHYCPNCGAKMESEDENE